MRQTSPIIIILLALAACVTATPKAQAQSVAVKTNLLYDATLTPNLGVEMGLGKRTTAQLSYGLNPWKFSEGKSIRHWQLMGEGRYWLCSKFNGHFLGVHAMGGQFNMAKVNARLYTNAQLPEAFKGYKIVHISDLHLSTYDDRPAALQRIVDSINAQQPDLICFTGDLVTIGVSEEASPYTDILRQLHATDGVVSVLGNHDMLIYTQLSEQRRLAEVEHLADYERTQLGWHLLRNEHLTIERNGQHINIIGVDNCSCEGEGFRTIYAGDLQKAKAGTDGFSILLSHDPSHWRAEVLNTDIPLTGNRGLYYKSRYRLPILILSGVCGSYVIRM